MTTIVIIIFLMLCLGGGGYVGWNNRSSLSGPAGMGGILFFMLFIILGIWLITTLMGVAVGPGGGYRPL